MALISAHAAAAPRMGARTKLRDAQAIFLRARRRAWRARFRSRSSRDALCLYIVQHRMTGSERDIAQYISLALYLSPWPDFEVTDEITDMPPDATQVVEIVPILKDF